MARAMLRLFYPAGMHSKIVCHRISSAFLQGFRAAIPAKLTKFAFQPAMQQDLDLKLVRAQ